MRTVERLLPVFAFALSISILALSQSYIAINVNKNLSSDELLSSEAKNQHEQPTPQAKKVPPICLLRSYHQLCFSFDGLDARDCHSDPEGFMKTQFAMYKPTQRELEMRKLVSENKIQSISVGAGKAGLCNQVGSKSASLCTDRAELDLFEINSWLSLVKGSEGGNGFDTVISEHVLEHFEPTQVERIAAASFAALKPGGVFRIAVPDGYKPSPSYQQYVRPGGTPSGQGQNHMVSWTVDTLPAIFKNAGFEIQHREHYWMNGTFFSADDAYSMDDIHGRINRSFKYDERNKKPYKSQKNKYGVLHASDLGPNEAYYTSLWFDAVKPKSCDVTLSIV